MLSTIFLFIVDPLFTNQHKTIQKFIRINNQIRAPLVRVINETGENLGDLPLTEALKRAYEKNLDLVEIAPHVNPPIVKITDYGKFKYQQEKKEREQHKKQKEVTVKTIKFSVTIGAHDKEIKAKMVHEFLGGGDKVLLQMMLRGRQKANRAFAEKKFKEFLQLLGNDIGIEQPMKNTPQGILMVISKKIKK